MFKAVEFVYTPIRAFRKIILLSLFLPIQIFGQTIPSADSLDVLIHQCLKYLKDTQKSATVVDSHFAGEWPTFMEMRTGYILLGTQKKVYDSNCFALAGMMNILADVYRIDTNLNQIPRMLENAYPQLISYKDNNGFNFWPSLKPNGKMLSKEDSARTDVKVRRPIRFKILNNYIRRAANIMNDNDDTAQGLLAEWNYQSISGNSIFHEEFPRFDDYRDTLRSNIHYYNHFARDPRSSGAFLTWRGEEQAFPTQNLVKLLINNALFLTPKSTAYPYAYQPYMPYGSNDVDAVVNANVLATMATLKINSDGIWGASNFIEQKIKREKWSRAGIYYPNRYQIHYAVIKAWKSGVSSLSNCIEPLIDHIKTSQLPNGSFESRRIVNKKDPIQSTAYALNAMLKFGNPKITGLDKNVTSALNYLLSQAHFENGKVFWSGGVYFSGGTVIRNTLYWKSDALTTAIILESLCLMRKYHSN
jgi:hypothetical protein